MRIGIDARPLQGRFTGDHTYWRGLILGLSRLVTNDEFYLYTYPRLSPPDPGETGGFETRAIHAMSWRTWSTVRFPLALRSDGVDVAHVQYAIPPIPPCPMITSIHDISFKRYPRFFTLKDRVILDTGVAHSAQYAARILTISNFTKRELMECYRIPESKIEVIYPGVDEQYRPLDRDEARNAVWARYSIEGPFIMTAGVIQPRKNLPTLLEAFACLKGIGCGEIKLVIVGKYGWKEKNLLRVASHLGISEDVLLTGYVPYEDLPCLYNAAEVFVYPSVYEGFGLPPLEAMACGTPVIAGNRSSLPEVVGDAGIMVDPCDPECFAYAMRNVLSSSDLRADMSMRGLEQARKFSWDKMAREVDSIYGEVGAEKRHGRST